MYMIMGFFGAVRIIMTVAIAVLAYVLSSFALYNIAKNNGIKHSWTAFVPFLQYYIIGSLCEEYELFGVTLKPLGVLMPLLAMTEVLISVMGSFWTFIPVLILSAVFALIMHKFFYLFDPRKALMLAFLTIFGQLITAVVLFYIKDLRLQMSAGAYAYPFGDKR